MKLTEDVIDVHCHVISPDRNKYPLAPIGGTQSDWSAKRSLTPEQLLKAMDEAGVTKAAVVQASTAYGHDSSYLADAIARFPDRLTGVFSIDPLAPNAIEEFKRWTGCGMTGLRVFTTGTTMPGQQTWLADEAAYPVWQAAADCKIPVAVQMTPKGIPLLEKIVRAFPETNFLLDHFARISLEDGPPYAGARSLFSLAAFRNVYLKLTSRVVEQCHGGAAGADTFMPLVLEKFGAARMLWGSNYPAHDDTLSNILRDTRGVLQYVSEQDRVEILSGTAKRLYPSLA